MHIFFIKCFVNNKLELSAFMTWEDKWLYSIWHISVLISKLITNQIIYIKQRNFCWVVLFVSNWYKKLASTFKTWRIPFYPQQTVVVLVQCKQMYFSSFINIHIICMFYKHSNTDRKTIWHLNMQMTVTVLIIKQNSEADWEKRWNMITLWMFGI